MEDYILREIDRLGEMLLMIARRLGLLDGDTPDYSLTEVKDEFDKAGCPINLDSLLQREDPGRYLIEDCKLSDHGLETMIDIIFHSDLDETRKNALLEDALAYLDGKGYFSFRLHSLIGGKLHLSVYYQPRQKETGPPQPFSGRNSIGKGK